MGSPRFEFEKCVTGRCKQHSHPAPPRQPARGVALTLATFANADDGMIPEEFAPSLTGLARASGFGRSTVIRALAALEDLGWLEVQSPPVDLARSAKVTNAYRLTVPGPVAALAPQRDQSAGVTAGPALVPERTSAGARAGHNQTLQTMPAAARAETDKENPMRKDPHAEQLARIAGILGVTDPGLIVDAWARHRPEVRNPFALIARMADDEIRKLARYKPTATTPPCPDCNGEGWIYTETDSGVDSRKCTHPRRAAA